MGRFTYYKGWHILYNPIGSQTWQAIKHGVSIRANTKELLYSMIDNRKELKLNWEDIEKYATEEEKIILESKLNPRIQKKIENLVREVSMLQKTMDIEIRKEILRRVKITARLLYEYGIFVGMGGEI